MSIYKHVDLDGGGSSTSPYDTWAKATGDLHTAMAATSAGDFVFVKGNTNSRTSDLTVQGRNSNAGAATTMIIGVKAATTNEGVSIVQSDLIPGYLTGDAAKAYDQTSGNAAPIVKTANTGVDIFFNGNVWCYGIRFQSASRILMLNNNTKCVFEECEFIWGQTDTTSDFFIAWTGGHFGQYFKCKLTPPNNTSALLAVSNNSYLYAEFFDTEFNFAAAVTQLFAAVATAAVGNVLWHGTDFSVLSSLTAIFPSGAANQYIGGGMALIGCKLGSGDVVTNGNPAWGGGGGASITGPASMSFSSGADPGSPLGTGESDQSLEFIANTGDIIEETTAVRTGGADDGATGAWALAITPITGMTTLFYECLYSPWLDGWIDGDGTSKIVTVYIANDSGADLNDDGVWLEVMYPSSDGNKQADFIERTRMDLFATPSAVTDDATSTWGTGGDNPQKLQATIAPKYSGPVRVRVAFAPGTTDTLYVDPKLDIA